ncbi:hypothetical protein [Mesorhizobium neociceri]|uniref:Uncharacterized protein n=1 Tax=Mesorhizobium neociceri TaxID=1307853 RepID=A0A838B0P7_9HYPH|nr:hypothetical protein [Mesorhizobium neociceri]MBA1140246.1 hypothetical protein [Mesorhizobium neociceri]
MGLISIIIFTAIGYFIYRDSRRNGSLTLPIGKFDRLRAEIVNDIYKEIYELEADDDERKLLAGFHLKTGFSLILAKKLDSCYFPHEKIHDLSKAVIDTLKSNERYEGAHRLFDQVRNSFKFVDTYYDKTHKSWQKVDYPKA